MFTRTGYRNRRRRRIGLDRAGREFALNNWRRIQLWQEVTILDGAMLVELGNVESSMFCQPVR
jgi:hypothetical protein